MSKMIMWLSVYCHHPVFYVVITGNCQFTTNHDIRIAMMQVGNFITQKDINIVQKYIEQLPWIRQVSIRKQWPDSLKIHLVEYIPRVYWNDDLAISMDGVVFKIPENKICKRNYNNISIPILYGPINKAQDVLYSYLIFNEIIKSSKFQIKSLSIDTCYSWKLILENNICLKLGINNIIKRFLYFIKVYPILFQKMHEQNSYIDYIDLRYRSGIAVKWIYNSIVPDPEKMNYLNKGNE